MPVLPSKEGRDISRLYVKKRVETGLTPMFHSPTRRRRVHLIGLLLGLFSLAAATGLQASSIDVTDILLGKVIVFLQISPADPGLERTPFAILAVADARTPGSILGGSFGPAGGSFSSLSALDNTTFSFGQNFETPDELNTAFPDGLYSFDLQTVTAPTEFVSTLTLMPRAPAVVPKLLNSEWYSVLLQFNSTASFTFNWNYFVDFQTDPAHPSTVEFQISNIFDELVFDQSYDQPVTSVVVPANTLAPNQFYVGRILFAHLDLTQIDFTQLKPFGLYMTEFIISAVDGPPVIQGQTSITVNAGQLFIHIVEATNVPGQFAATNLPPGIVFDGDFGLIGGYPTTPGTYNVGLSASNSLGTGSAILTVNVLPAGALAITTSTRAAGSVGDPFRFQVLAPGASTAARLSTSGLPPGITANPVTGVISGTPTIAGDFLVRLTVTDGGNFADGVLVLSFNADPAFPGIRSATSATLAPGQNFTYTIDAVPDSTSTDPTTYSIIGALPAGLSFDPSTGTISGTYDNSPQRSPSKKPDLAGGALVGSVQLFASNSRGTSTIPLVFFTPPIGVVNISTRMTVGAGDNALIGGFIITGNAPKKLIVRAIGPSLPVTGALQDPVLEIHAADGTLLAMNDDWKSDYQQEIVDTTVAPSNDREAAIVGAFQPGTYTAIVRGKNGATGTGLVELYDLGTASLDASSDAKLANISTRGIVQSGDNVMIGGFIISGQPTRVIIRAIGPELNGSVPGALQDTLLELHDGSGTLIASNDDWKTSQQQAIIDTGVPPTDDRESAIVATLSPGGYTAVVRGKNGTTGVALAEVYVLQ
jgi:hypothetical protein